MTGIELTTAVGNKKIKVNRQVMFDVVVQTKKHRTVALVVKDLFAPILLGMNWLKEHRVQIDCYNGTLDIGDVKNVRIWNKQGVKYEDTEENIQAETMLIDATCAKENAVANYVSKNRGVEEELEMNKTFMITMTDNMSEAYVSRSEMKIGEENQPVETASICTLVYGGQGSVSMEEDLAKGKVKEMKEMEKSGIWSDGLRLESNSWKLMKAKWKEKERSELVDGLEGATGKMMIGTYNVNIL